MTHHPNEPLIEIVGIEESGRGRSCEEHAICGAEALVLDSVVRFRSIQQMNEQGKEESAIGVFWVTDGIDRCLVGFLPRHMVKHKAKYDGRVAQIVEFLKDSTSPSQRRRSYANRGMCLAAFLQNPTESEAENDVN